MDIRNLLPTTELRVEILEAQLQQCSQGTMLVSSFLKILDEEIDRVSRSAQKELKRIQLQCQDGLASDGEATSNSETTLRHAAVDKANNNYIKLLSHLNETMIKAKKIVSSDPKIVDLGMQLLDHRFDLAPWALSSHSGMIVLFSDAYEGIRMSQTREYASAVWKAPSAFARSTTKYWVESDKLNELLATLTKDAPLLVYGEKWPLSSKIEEPTQNDSLWTKMASSISSLYFDTPKMAMYNDRIARKEGAQLFRIRWYGERPKGEQLVFLELKTHHEKWINCKSVKERVSIREKDVMDFLSRSKWSLKDAKRLVEKAASSTDNEEIKRDSSLLLRMHELVVTRDLRPCVRSVYQRLAFQSSKSNALRLTIDRNVTLVDERSTPKNIWSLESIENAAKVVVPYPVFEVKLAGSDMPPNIQGLIDRAVAVEAQKFSKFLTGAAAFNQDTIKTLPYWAEYPAFSACFGVVNDRLGKNRSLSETERSSESNLTFEDDSKESKKSFLSRLFGSRSLKVAPQRPARVEPKSYFANERTFIQWIGGAFFLLSLSVITTEIVGEVTSAIMFLLALSVVLVFYSVFVYYRRLHLLQSGSPVGYVDRVGPILLAFAVLAGVLLVKYQTISDLKTANTLSVSQKCSVYDLPMSTLEFEPSDIFADSFRDLLFVTSRSKIYTIDRNGSAKLVAEVASSDFEAISQSYDGRVWAVSEGLTDKADSTLYSFLWDDQEELLLMDGSWKIPSTGAEGMAFVPGSDGSSFRLYVASDAQPSSKAASTTVNSSTRGSVHVYEIPQVGFRAEPVDILNSKVLGNGLEDSKIGAIQYLDGIMYLLHDNAKVVRAWNLTSGELLSEWALPHVGNNGTFDDQWEGMFIEKAETANNLRGSSKSDILLHLTLDSPGQVWTLSAEEENGYVRLPACAAP